MTANRAMFVFTLGMILTLGGVGSIETSMDDLALASGVVVSGVGLLVMWVGTILMKRLDN